MLMSCRHMTELSSAELERPLRVAERLELNTHLMMCGPCREFRQQARRMRALMQRYAAGQAPGGDDTPPEAAPRA